MTPPTRDADALLAAGVDSAQELSMLAASVASAHTTFQLNFLKL